jgi:hypothetical protein
MFFTCEVAKCVKVIVARLSLQSRLEMNLHNLLAFLVPRCSKDIMSRPV